MHKNRERFDRANELYKNAKAKNKTVVFPEAEFSERMQKAVEIKDGDTPEILQKRVMEQAEWIILPLAVQKICEEL